jgi:hypothetical protein
MCRDIRTKFHKDWFRHSKVNRGETHTHGEQRDLTSLLYFFQNKESRLKNKASRKVGDQFFPELLVLSLVVAFIYLYLTGKIQLNGSTEPNGRT